MIVLITLADVVTPGNSHFGPLLVAAPAITASFAGPLLTAAMGLLAIAGEVLIADQNGLLGIPAVRTEIVAMALVTAFVVLFCFVRDRERRQLIQVRSIAEVAQRALLRPVPDHLGPLRLASAYLAAETDARIGGDLFGAIRTTGRTRVIIGDARGKGLPAVSDATVVLGAFREAARRQVALPTLGAELDDSVRFNIGLDQLPDLSENVAEGFVTAAVLDIPDDKTALTMVNCGHPPPLIMRSGRVATLDGGVPAPPLGLGPLCGQPYTEHAFAFDDGDLLLLYTDGVIEARDSTGAFYPLAERISRWADQTPDALVAHICDDLLAHVGGRLGDDAALIAVRRYPPSTTPIQTPPLPGRA
ncbi:PP2C family protein-serine/threonine phosphatase [Nonomuraea sp. NPDC049784]|uniref:PP2C family protein-serine/threonine phosphatase n=1 Tax=Nonomuraea sp. NPDC049784 TaxID=3154361 RepID=UPI0033E532D9